jgi:hypothetical protein
MLSHSVLQDPSLVMVDDEEAIEYSKGQGRDIEEVHSDTRFAMVAEEGLLLIRWRGISWCFPHPAQDTSLRYIKAEHSEFAMDPRCAPRAVLKHHAED